MRFGGAYRSENVGISSKNSGENPEHRKSKVSWATQIDPGLVGPKARPKGVVDGQLVNIPAPRIVYCLLTHFRGRSVLWLCASSSCASRMKERKTERRT